jgi:hypothetical protein
MLRETFGDKFDAWKRQTRLLIPRPFWAESSALPPLSRCRRCVYGEHGRNRVFIMSGWWFPGSATICPGRLWKSSPTPCSPSHLVEGLPLFSESPSGSVVLEDDTGSHHGMAQLPYRERTTCCPIRASCSDRARRSSPRR